MDKLIQPRDSEIVEQAISQCVILHDIMLSARKFPLSIMRHKEGLGSGGDGELICDMCLEVYRKCGVITEYWYRGWICLICLRKL